ncbi:hypothetical protein OGZ51_06890 [Lactococcus lactis]|uniref:Uncharacterized protein n=1 Tax=Lactococcus lactis TaxID=1358 RepID=A0A9X4NHJ7_9LACT|nr:hypothetical protein [Lactococcus lactis]MDG4983867.1 hypothetical protein [Lactococcus lactis]
MFKKMLLTLTVLLGCVGLVGFSQEAFAGTISIQNVHSFGGTISASLNTYGDGHSGYYDIPYSKSESWSRSDNRGFIMSIKDNGTLRTYYSRPSVDYYYDGKMYKTEDPSGQHLPLTILKTTTDFTPTGSSQIKINDYAGTDVQVGVSTWDGGQSGYYSLSHGDTEKWSRDFDARGYLLYIKFSGNSKTYVYYVPNSNKEIGVYGLNNLVIDGNQPLQEVYAF